ncbi:MAG: MarR family transcriptional regulator [Chloroflexi bacterium]|nr:MarR family transcriptional regulator [Chloroflexota bacterium]
MANWAFVTNHGAVLALIAQHGQITARDIAAELGITERSVHRIISDLEAEGYLRRRRDGRLNRYQVAFGRLVGRSGRGEQTLAELVKVLQPGTISDESAASA